MTCRCDEPTALRKLPAGSGYASTNRRKLPADSHFAMASTQARKLPADSHFAMAPESPNRIPGYAMAPESPNRIPGYAMAPNSRNHSPAVKSARGPRLTVAPASVAPAPRPFLRLPPPSNPVGRTAAKISGCCAASTDALRTAVAHAGAPSLATTADRPTLIQALGLPGASHLGGQSPAAVMLAAGVSRDEVVGAGLNQPDPLLLRPNLGDQFARLPIVAPIVPGSPVDPTGLLSWISMRGAGPDPAPVDFRPGNWDLDKCEYTIAQGDTFWGLSKTYLAGDPNRWKEIWTIQPGRYTHSPDPASSAKTGNPLYRPGEKLIMPPEACERAEAWSKPGSDKPQAPATPGAPAYDNPNRPDPARQKGKGKLPPPSGGGGGSSRGLFGLSEGATIALGVGAVALVGAAVVLT